MGSRQAGTSRRSDHTPRTAVPWLLALAHLGAVDRRSPDVRDAQALADRADSSALLELGLGEQPDGPATASAVCAGAWLRLDRAERIRWARKAILSRPGVAA